MIMGAPGSGKRDHQKLKSYIVLDYLMKQSDEEHTVSAKDIIDYLQEECGIETERRSIYRDIDETNKVLYMLENECSIQEAEEAIDDPECGGGEKFIDEKRAKRPADVAASLVSCGKPILPEKAKTRRIAPTGGIRGSRLTLPLVILSLSAVSQRIRKRGMFKGPDPSTHFVRSG